MKVPAFPAALAGSAAYVLCGCGSQPIHIEKSQLNATAAMGVSLPCHVEWKGLTDLRSVRDPIGYMGAKSVNYPDLANDLQERISKAVSTSVVSGTGSLAVAGELVRASVEHRSTLIHLDLTFRLRSPPESQAPIVFITSTRKMLMTGSDREGLEFMNRGITEAVNQFVERIYELCSH